MLMISIVEQCQCIEIEFFLISEVEQCNKIKSAMYLNVLLMISIDVKYNRIKYALHWN